MKPASNARGLLLAGALILVADTGNPASAAPVASNPAAAGSAIAGSTIAGSATSDPVTVNNDWIETARYKFRLDALKSCDHTPASRRWVGFQVRVNVLTKELFVSPRDLTLERGGLILDAKYLEPPSFRNCAPLLPRKQLRARQTLRGFVLFEVPPSFLAARGPITLAYRPTIWGGAKRIELTIPDCLDACVKPDASKSRDP